MPDALIHLRVPAATKARWVRESRDAGLRLTDWIAERIEPGGEPEPRAEKIDSARSHGNHLVDSARLLRLMQLMCRSGTSRSLLQDELGISRASLTRLIAVARAQFGVRIAWTRGKTIDEPGEYSIDDWGVLDETRVRRWKP